MINYHQAADFTTQIRGQERIVVAEGHTPAARGARRRPNGLTGDLAPRFLGRSPHLQTKPEEDAGRPTMHSAMQPTTEPSHIKPNVSGTAPRSRLCGRRGSLLAGSTVFCIQRPLKLSATAGFQARESLCLI